jgi:hypothetical protein
MKIVIHSFPKILIGLLNKKKKSQESSVGIATRTWAGQLRIQGLISGTGNRFFSSPLCPDWLWGPVSLLYNGYQGLFHLR